MMNGKGFGRNRFSPNQAIARFVRMHLFTFLISNHILFYFCSIFSLAHQFLVPSWIPASAYCPIPVQQPTYQNHPPAAVYPHRPFRHPLHQYITYAAYLVFPPRILFLDCFILKKEALRSFETSGTTCPKTRGIIPDDVNLLLFRN